MNRIFQHPRLSKLIAMVLALTIGACGKSELAQPKAGGLYSVENGDGSYRIVKILALDPEIVHVRIYENKFNSRPESIDPSALALGSIQDPEGFGIGHLPLDEGEFSSWHPVFLLQTTVDDDELEGYKYWKDSGGGAWGGKKK